jgi:hypothetical protein
VRADGVVVAEKTEEGFPDEDEILADLRRRAV